MGLFSIIDVLFIAAHYLAWGIAVLGIPVSVVLLFANLSLGAAPAAMIAALLLLAAGLAVILMPKKVAEHVPVLHKLLAPAGALCVVAVVVAGVAFFLNGALPALNLLFA